jgi:indole-3-glycerol phosphate synthase
LSKLSSSLPSNVLDNVILDNVRLLLDSTKNRNFTFLNRAEKTLRNNLQQLYPEDIAIIESGIKTAKSLLGL